MQQKRLNGPVIFCWFSGAVFGLCLMTAMIVNSSLDTLSQTSGEVSSVASRLDSVSGLRSLLLSFSSQCTQAQESWSGALTSTMGIVFLCCLVGFALVATLAVQVSMNRKQARQIVKLQQALKR